MYSGEGYGMSYTNYTVHGAAGGRTLIIRGLEWLSRVLMMLFWISVMLAFDSVYTALCTLLAAVIHEGGHIAALYAVKGRRARGGISFCGRGDGSPAVLSGDVGTAKPGGTAHDGTERRGSDGGCAGVLSAAINGFRIKTGYLSYGEEALVALAGPLVNLLAAIGGGIFILLSGISRGGGGAADGAAVIAAVNLLTALSNLLPVRGYDGQKLLRAALSARASADLADTVCRAVSLFLICAGCFLSLYLMLRLSCGYWLCGIMTASLLSELSDIKK